MGKCISYHASSCEGLGLLHREHCNNWLTLTDSNDFYGCIKQIYYEVSVEILTELLKMTHG